MSNLLKLTIMLLLTNFTAFGENLTFGVDTDNLDRNYDDENYSYWVIEHDGRYFEVNIWKDENGNYTNKGKVYAFLDLGNLEQAGDADEEADIEFETVTL